MTYQVQTDSSAADANAAKSQAFVCAVSMLVMLGLVGFAQLAMRFDGLVVSGRVAQWKQTTGMYADQRFFSGAEDRLLYSVLPSADYSHGGLYFTGASVTERSLMTWDWPRTDQPWVHNYCIAAANHAEQAQFIRDLVNHENLLAAGGQHTVIFTELCFGNAAQSHSKEFLETDASWHSFFLRLGLYTQDENGLTPAPKSKLLRWAKLTAFRNGAFWAWVDHFAALNVQQPYLVPGIQMSPADARAFWARRMGPDWESAMDNQLRQYAELIDYLHSRRVKVVAVYMPLGSWFRAYPQADRYRATVLPMLAAKSVEVIDLEQSVDDTGFADSSHLNYRGSVEVQPHLIHAAEKYLTEIR
jgi:hypothetical protein